MLRVFNLVPSAVPWLWDKAYNATEFFVIVVCALRARSARGTERAAWAVLTIGLFGYAAGDIYYVVALEGLDAPPYPSWADAGYLSIFPAAYVALVLLLRARAGRVSSVLWLDGLVCGLTIAAVGAALVFGVVASTEGSLSTVVTNLAYPLGDLCLLAFVIAVIAITGWRAGLSWLVLGAAFATWAVADVIYLYQTALGTYRDYTPLDLTWPGAYLLIGIAACLPARRIDARRLRGGLLILPATFTLVALGLLVVDHYVRLNEAAIWLACGAIVAAVVRFALTFRENLRTLSTSENEAMTDALTGLGNRRALLLDLERAVTDAGRGRAATLATFDLDGFKAYNDSFGHPAGDALLVRLGRNLTAAVGHSASAYRMGGDEFCVLAVEPLDSAAVDRAGDGRAQRAWRALQHRLLRGRGAAFPPKSATPRMRCGSATSACTRTRDAAGAPSTRPCTTCCCASPPSMTASCATTSTMWPSWPEPSVRSSGSMRPT